MHQIQRPKPVLITMSATKGKLLFLHGFTQSGSLFAKKTSALRKALQKQGYQCFYIDAPVELSAPDLPFDTSNLDSSADTDWKSWWVTNQNKPDYYKLDKAFDSVRDAIEKDGPFDGVMGFSQGAAMAGVLCSQIHNLHEKQPPVKYGVLFCGFRIAPEEYQKFFEPPIATNTLHVLGSLDTVVSEERSLGLWNACDEKTRTMIKHPGGHFVPNSKNFVTDIIGWLENAGKDKQEAKEDEDDWDQFDAIGGR